MPFYDKLIKGHLKGHWRLDELLFPYSVMFLNRILQYVLNKSCLHCTDPKREIWETKPNQTKTNKQTS